MTRDEIETKVGRAISDEEFRKWHGIGLNPEEKDSYQQRLLNLERVKAMTRAIDTKQFTGKKPCKCNQSAKKKDNDLTFLVCHNKTDDLLCHVDIMEIMELPYVVLYSGSKDLDIDHIKFSPQAHNAPGIGVLTALDICRKERIETFRYVNGDDWLFRKDLIETWFAKLNAFDLCGYSWKGQNLITDLTVNELYLRVDAFNHLNIEERLSELESKTYGYVEDHIAKILRTKLNVFKFFRLPGREIRRGIGFQTDKWDRDNSRWFNRAWQLIGSHDDKQRFDLYCLIRPFIPYHLELESRPDFGNWFRYHCTLESEVCKRYAETCWNH